MPRDSASARRLNNEQPFLADGPAHDAATAAFPKSYGKPCVDDRRVLSGMIFINRNGLWWYEAPKEYGLLTTP
jgi:hypothetical protein